MTMRAAIVGLTHPHTRGWAQTLDVLSGRLTVVGVHDADQGNRALVPEPFADKPFFTSLEALIEERRPEVALVGAATGEAAALVTRLAEAGVHMIVDKPAARTVEEARRAADAVRRANVKVAVGFANRLNPAIQELRRLCKSGAVGRLLAFEARHISGQVRRWPNGSANPLFSREVSGGGHLHWLGIHYLDLMCYLAEDEVAEVTAFTDNVGGQPIDVEDCAVVGLRFRGGALGVLHCGNLAPSLRVEQYFAARGEHLNATVRLHEPSEEGSRHGLHLVSDGEHGPLEQDMTFIQKAIPGYGGISGRTLANDLLDAIEQDRQPMITFDDIVLALQIIEAAHESSSTGRTVALAR